MCLATKYCRKNTNNTLLWINLVNRTFVAHKRSIFDVDVVTLSKLKFNFSNFFRSLRIVQHFVDFFLRHRCCLACSSYKIAHASCFFNKEEDIL